jgi:hypothetical protein
MKNTVKFTTVVLVILFAFFGFTIVNHFTRNIMEGAENMDEKEESEETDQEKIMRLEIEISERQDEINEIRNRITMEEMPEEEMPEEEMPEEEMPEEEEI